MRIIAIIGALLGWFGLVLQLGLLVEPMGGWPQAIWRFLGYFTLLTNIWVALVFTHAAFRPASRTGLGGARMVFSATVSIVLVGIVYAVALRGLWQPQGLDAVADNILHVAIPIVSFIFLLVSAAGPISWKAALWSLVWPLAYFAYAMARGAFDGWYAYWFLNPSEQSLADLAISIGLLLLGVLVLAQILAGLTRLCAGRA